MAKLNLKALHNTSIPETLPQTNSVAGVTPEQKEISSPVLTQPTAAISPKEPESTETGKKKKISLKSIIKPTTSENAPIEENTPAVMEAKEEIVSQAPVAVEGKKEEVTQAPSLVEVKEEEKVSSQAPVAVEGKKEEVTQAPIALDVNKSIEKLEILDGDTHCAIIKEDDTNEIFASYKGSFSKEEESKTPKLQEVKKPIVEEVKLAKTIVIEETTPKEITPSIIAEEEKISPAPAENEIKVSQEEDPKASLRETPATTEKKDETTALEKVSAKKPLNKKIIYSSLVTVFCIAVFGFTFMKSDLVKTSVPDIPNPPVENTPVESPVSTPVETNTPPVGENTNQIENNQIVKENENNSIDNNENNVKINKKVANFLMKKYKVK